MPALREHLSKKKYPDATRTLEVMKGFNDDIAMNPETNLDTIKKFSSFLGNADVTSFQNADLASIALQHVKFLEQLLKLDKPSNEIIIINQQAERFTSAISAYKGNIILIDMCIRAIDPETFKTTLAKCIDSLPEGQSQNALKNVERKIDPMALARTNLLANELTQNYLIKDAAAFIAKVEKLFLSVIEAKQNITVPQKKDLETILSKMGDLATRHQLSDETRLQIESIRSIADAYKLAPPVTPRTPGNSAGEQKKESLLSVNELVAFQIPKGESEDARKEQAKYLAHLKALLLVEPVNKSHISRHPEIQNLLDKAATIELDPTRATGRVKLQKDIAIRAGELGLTNYAVLDLNPSSTSKKPKPRENQVLYSEVVVVHPHPGMSPIQSRREKRGGPQVPAPSGPSQ